MSDEVVEISHSDSDSDHSLHDKNNTRTVESTFIGVGSRIVPEKKTSENIDEEIINGSRSTEGGLGVVGIKWRVRIVRIYDSEEQWKGIVEIYFHWSVFSSAPAKQQDSTSNDNRPRRRMSVAAMTSKTSDMEIIETPTSIPQFVILNDEESTCTEAIYYKCAKSPFLLFGYVSYTVTVHERLELERYPFDRQFFKLEIECSNGDIVPWYSKQVPSLVRNRLDAQAEKAHFFGVCDTPSWTLDLVLVKRGDRLSSAMFSLGLSRLSGFYISNVAVPYFLIGSGAVLTSGIEPQDYASRLQCMVSLFLTLVAIKFVASFLPVISYSTLLDYYTLVAYIFLAVWMVENFLVSPLFVGGGQGQQEEARRVDVFCASVYLLLWLAIHVTIMIGNYYDIFRKPWKEVQQDDEEDNPLAHKETNCFTREIPSALL